MGDLHPIVIPAIEGTYKSIKFTCSGEGLYKDGYLYDAHAEKLIPPKNPKAGTEPKEKKPVAYWKAQCAFRGLNQTGAMADLQLRLREAKQKILPEIKAMENELNKAFKKKNKASRDNSWTSLKSAEQKAKMNPKRYLTETFPKGGSGRPANMDIVVLKLESERRLEVANIAEAMKLEAVSVDAPWTCNKKPVPDRWLIIGRTRDVVWSQMKEVEREAGRSKQTYAAEKTKPKPTKQAKSVAKDKTSISRVKSGDQNTKSSSEVVHRARSPLRIGPMPRPVGEQRLQTARKSAFPERASKEEDQKISTKATDSSWDITGQYAINCPEIEDQWPGDYGDDSLTLDLHLETKNGKRQLFGAFDFRIIDGIMRFEKPVPVAKIEKDGECLKKRKRDDLDDDRDASIERYPDFTSTEGPSVYSESVFHLGAKDRPTARRPIWRFRWRGKETGEGEIQLYSDRAVQSITFSDKGRKISGSFFCDIVEGCQFTGTKVSSSTSDRGLDPQREWEKHSSAAHEEAKNSRWY
ncbi:hypothetical protein WAI453_008154 [Rhynchosporium graminicola]